MEAKVKLIISQDEFDEHCKGYQELNGNLPTMKQVKETFIDWFMSNKNDYIDRHCDIDVILEINDKEVLL